MLCYRCGSHAPDASETCPACCQRLGAGGRAHTETGEVRRWAGASAEVAPYRPGEVVGGRFRVLASLGCGPLGWVLRAREEEVGGQLALKVIRPHLVQAPEERQHFADALWASREVGHTGVVRVLHVGEDRGCLFLAMPFLEGVSLRRVLELRFSRGQRFSLQEVEKLLVQLAGILDAAHRVGPHAGLKPENVLVLPDALRVTDFALGLAIPRQPFVQAQRQVRVDRYLAPEVVEGGDAVDGRADVYSLGVLLGEMLTGLLPEGSVPELRRAHPALPAQLDGLYRRALHRNPRARPQTAGELLMELSALVRRATAAAPLPAPPVAVDDDDAPTQAMQAPEGWGTPAGPLAAPPPDPSLAEDPSSADTEVIEASADALPALEAGEPAVLAPVGRRERTEVLEPLAEQRGLLLAPRLRAWGQRLGAMGHRPYLWLVLLSVGGMAAGVAAGLWLLHHLPTAPSVIPLPPEEAPASGGSAGGPPTP